MLIKSNNIVRSIVEQGIPFAMKINYDNKKDIMQKKIPLDILNEMNTMAESAEKNGVANLSFDGACLKKCVLADWTRLSNSIACLIYCQCLISDRHRPAFAHISIAHTV